MHGNAAGGLRRHHGRRPWPLRRRVLYATHSIRPSNARRGYGRLQRHARSGRSRWRKLVRSKASGAAMWKQRREKWNISRCRWANERGPGPISYLGCRPWRSGSRPCWVPSTSPLPVVTRQRPLKPSEMCSPNWTRQSKDWQGTGRQRRLRLRLFAPMLRGAFNMF